MHFVLLDKFSKILKLKIFQLNYQKLQILIETCKYRFIHKYMHVLIHVAIIID